MTGMSESDVPVGELPDAAHLAGLPPVPDSAVVVHPASAEGGGVLQAVMAEEKAAEKPKVKRSAPKWETDARDRLKAAIRRYAKPLLDLVARDANEGDTRLLVTDFLCDAFG